MPDRDLAPVELAISTCARTPNYIDRTLESLERSQARVQLRLIVCGPDANFLSVPRRAQYAAQLEVVPAREWLPMRHWPIDQRIVGTLIRALEGPTDRPVLVCQDDVEFSWRWEERLERARHLLTRQIGEQPYLLTLFSTRPAVGDGPVPYDPRLFFGTVAVYVPGLVRDELSRFLAAHSYEAPDDLLVKRFCSEGNALLFDLQPNAVQHIGTHSSKGGVSPIQSPSYTQAIHRR